MDQGSEWWKIDIQLLFLKFVLERSTWSPKQILEKKVGQALIAAP